MKSADLDLYFWDFNMTESELGNVSEVIRLIFKWVYSSKTKKLNNQILRKETAFYYTGKLFD